MFPKPFVYRVLAPVALLASAALFVLAALVLACAGRRVAQEGHLAAAEARHAVFHVCTEADVRPFSKSQWVALGEGRARRDLARALPAAAGCDAISGVPTRVRPASSP